MRTESYKNAGPMLPGFAMCESAEKATCTQSNLSPEGFPVPTLAQQENEPVSLERKVDYGVTSLVLLASYDPALCLWKTPQICLNGEWEEYSQTWPAWGTMQNGVCYRLRNVAHRTYANESSLWPTPTATHTTLPRNPHSIMNQVNKHHLNGYVARWPTPTATDGKRYTRNLDYFTRRKAAGYYNLPTEVALSSSGPLPDGTYGQMNPTWVEWLMGFPLGWTDLED